MTLKFDKWPWKTIGHLFYVTSSAVHHFIAIGDFKLEIQSGNAQFGSKSTIFSQLCDLAIWCMTLKNNRTAFLPYFKLCVSFRSHWCIQTWVTVRKRPIWVKTDDFLVVWPCNLTYDLEKTIGHRFYSASSFVHHFVAIGVFKLELQSGNAQFESNSMIFKAVWPWNQTDDLEKQ